MHTTKKYRVFGFFLIIQWIFVQIFSRFPDVIEKYYSNGFYPIISRFFRIIFGWIPFSIGDFLYIFFLIYIIYTIGKIIKNRKVNFTKTLGYVSIIYFCFHLFWGMNYFRKPLHKSLKISTLDYSITELDSFTNQLISKTNQLQLKIMHNDTIKVTNLDSKKEIYAKVVNGYTLLSKEQPEFGYKTTSIKHSIISLPLTYMGFSGYLNPFTGEAQVNSINPSITYAVTSCHEVAHQLGYAAENEANFIGFLAAINNKDVYFQYSGYYMALRYALNDLYRNDKEKYKTAITKINKGVLKNMKESQDFWNSYKNPFEVYFKKFFNLFLKVNKQPEGIKSYNGMLGMLINYNNQYPNELEFIK